MRSPGAFRDVPKWLAAAVVCGAIAGEPAFAQRGGGACSFAWDNNNYFVHPDFAGNPIYEGRITFARIKYAGNFECGAEGPGWSHDYPITENHLVTIMQNITSIRPFMRQGPIQGSAILRWDEPELFKYPVAWLSEPGGWWLNPAELKGFKQYVQRGGFVIFDDMGWRGRPDVPQLMSQWRLAFPKATPILLTADHPIFNAFFKIDLNKISSFCNNQGCYGQGGLAEYLAIFEDNDPKKRMLAVINNNQDLGEFMEFSDQGMNVVPSNEAYKLTINYFIYAVTH